MKTAVEWLVEHLTEYGVDLLHHEREIQQAKEMENERVTEAYRMGRIGKSIKEFNETFKSE
jgi:hypothetical protein